MFNPTDTIVAVATPPGRGAIGVVRLSGPRAGDIGATLTGAASFKPRHATLTRLHAATPASNGAHPIDRVLVTFFPRPQSYTGEDVLELSAHGSPAVLRSIVDAAVRAGARVAAPGEFTLRAFLNGRLDLAQAEAVADLVDAVTPLQARAACDQLEGTLSHAIREIDRALNDIVIRTEASLDFPEEGYHFIDPEALASEVRALRNRVTALLGEARRGRLVREGFSVVLVGRPNTGKSSLFNRLVGANRAIVTDRAGTTRDLLVETVDLRGLRATLVDTAGRTTTADPIEAEGVRRAVEAAEAADVAVCVLDRSAPLTPEDHEILAALAPRRRILAANKSDLAPAWQAIDDATSVIAVSAITGDGVDALVDAVLAALDLDDVEAEPPIVTSARHIGLLGRVEESLRRAEEAAAAPKPMPEEFVLADLHDARAALGEITGCAGGEDLLREIFARFCIGK